MNVKAPIRILHVDGDSFFASCEIALNPQLQERPVWVGGGFTLVRVVTESGRKHQIRAHAQWLGHSLVGDKIYGPDARLYLEFIDHGWPPALAARLDPVLGGRRLANYLAVMTLEAQTIARACGKSQKYPAFSSMAATSSAPVATRCARRRW